MDDLDVVILKFSYPPGLSSVKFLQNFEETEIFVICQDLGWVISIGPQDVVTELS